MIPIVLHHGLFGFGEIQLGRLRLCYFRGIDRALAGLGYPVIISRVHPTGSIAMRARQLKDTILSQLAILGREQEKVLIIAHSLGGLDSRYMISRLGMEDRVAALATVTTPHHGSPYADWCIRHLGLKLGGLNFMRKLGIDVQGIADLTTDSCAHFNDQTPDAPTVRYFSVSAAKPRHLVPSFVRHAHRIIFETDGDNDGLVSVNSARWGDHLETWPVDHFHAINRRITKDSRSANADVTPYYLRLVSVINRMDQNS